ncbi:hypothetical protein BDZ94DRAFT_852930 [Collybia nuda]|uniref:DUF6534 domain-containing protein n=1 Tax=Collybia nuda TaxID=64659 RepID=A0A9P5Y2L1_9AGAR|nr:hypothetical protein BDZ94DRAFT_852930 [Collybia nuda]
MLVAYLLNSGVVPSILSIAFFATILGARGNLIFLTLDEVATKLYVNSFMGMLNARYYLQSPSPKPTPAFFFQPETSSQTGPTGRIQGQAPAKTINEVGLPLFQSDSRESEKSSDIRVEVVVKQDTHCITK